MDSVLLRSKSSLVKLVIALGLFAAFYVFSGVKAEAKMMQTVEGDGSITVSWDNVTATDFSLGICKTTDTDDGMTGAKAMADGRTLVLPAGTTTYTFVGLENNSQYYIYLNYTYKYSETSTPSVRTERIPYAYTAVTGVTGLNQAKWWKYIKQVDVSWDKVAGKYSGVTYDVMFMDAAGKKVIESKTGLTSTSYSHAIKNNQIYTVKVRAIRTPDAEYSTCPTTVTPWTNVCYLFTQPTVTSAKVSGGKMKINWGKIKGASGYTVYVSTKRNSGYKKVASVKGSKSSVTVKKLKGKKFKSSKTYYVYIVAKKKAGGVTYTTGVNYTYIAKGSSRVRESYK